MTHEDILVLGSDQKIGEIDSNSDTCFFLRICATQFDNEAKGQACDFHHVSSIYEAEESSVRASYKQMEICLGYVYFVQPAPWL